MRVIQINLHHAKAATQVVAHTFCRDDLDIALLQEPWLKNNTVQGLHGAGNVLYNTNGIKPRACIIFNNKIDFLPVPEFCTDDLVAAFVKPRGRDGAKTIVCSAYLEGRRTDPTTELVKLTEFARYQNAELLVGCDANAHHTNWGSTDINSRVDNQRTTQDAELAASHNVDLENRTEPTDNTKGSQNSTEHAENRTDDNPNGYTKLLKRMETVPDIKRDTSGMTTQYIATGIVNLGAFAAGVCVAWSSSALPYLIAATPNHITESEASWVASLLCLGALWGAVPAGLISEYFGRKKTLLYLALPLVVSWILVSSSPNVYGLYVGRFVGGVAVGAFSVSIPPYVEDIAEKHLLPTLANFYHVLFTGGVLFGYIIAKVPGTSWLCFLSASIPVAFFIAFMFLPESPAYLISQGKQGEAKAALRYYRGIDNDIDAEIKQLKEYIRNSAKNRVTFQELFSTRATIKALVVSFGLMIFQQMSGIYAVLFNAERIFKTFASPLEAPGPAIILGFCLVSTTYFATMLLKKVRRRVLLIISLSTMAASLGSLAIYYHLKASTLVSSNNTWVPVFTLCIYVSVYAAGVGPIPWLMLREIFPPNVTRRATAITAGFHWFLAFGVTKLYQNLVTAVKPGWTLWHFAVTCIIGVIFVYFFVPETKGRSLEEIQNEFDGIHKKKKHRHVIEVESVSEC